MGRFLLWNVNKQVCSQTVWSEMSTNGVFPPQGAGRFGPQRCGTGRVSAAKKWAWPRLSRTEPYSSHSDRDERLSDTRRPVIGRQNRRFHATYPQGISGQRRKLCLVKKMLYKSLPSFLDVLHCWSLFIVRVLLFPWIYQWATLCRAVMRSRCLRSWRGYRRPA